MSVQNPPICSEAKEVKSLDQMKNFYAYIVNRKFFGFDPTEKNRVLREYTRGEVRAFAEKAFQTPNSSHVSIFFDPEITGNTNLLIVPDHWDRRLPKAFQKKGKQIAYLPFSFVLHPSVKNRTELIRVMAPVDAEIRMALEKPTPKKDNDATFELKDVAEDKIIERFKSWMANGNAPSKKTVSLRGASQVMTPSSLSNPRNSEGMYDSNRSGWLQNQSGNVDTMNESVKRRPGSSKKTSEQGSKKKNMLPPMFDNNENPINTWPSMAQKSGNPINEWPATMSNGKSSNKKKWWPDMMHGKTTTMNGSKKKTSILPPMFDNSGNAINEWPATMPKSKNSVDKWPATLNKKSNPINEWPATMKKGSSKKTNWWPAMMGNADTMAANDDHDYNDDMYSENDENEGDDDNDNLEEEEEDETTPTTTSSTTLDDNAAFNEAWKHLKAKARTMIGKTDTMEKSPSVTTHWFQNDDWFVPKVGPDETGEFRTDWLGTRVGYGKTKK